MMSSSGNFSGAPRPSTERRTRGIRTRVSVSATRSPAAPAGRRRLRGGDLLADRGAARLRLILRLRGGACLTVDLSASVLAERASVAHLDGARLELQPAVDERVVRVVTRRVGGEHLFLLGEEHAPAGLDADAERLAEMVEL